MKFVLSGLFIFISCFSYSQDLIVKLDSTNIFCNILKEDSSTIYYKAKKGNDVVEQSIKKSEVLRYYNSKTIVQNQIRMADSIAKAKPKFKNDSLFFKGKFKFTYHDTHFGNYKALILMKDNIEAHAEMRKAINSNLWNIFSTTIAISSFVAFGVDAIEVTRPELALLGVGAGFTALSFACNYFYHKHCYKAVNIYNAKLKIASASVPKFQFGMASRGLGISLKF